MTKEQQHDLLLSYSTPDVGLARNAAQVLEREGISVWWDQGERSDPALGTVSEILLHLMEPLLLRCKYLFLIATGAAFASHWVPVELSAFLESKRPVLVWHPRDDGFNPLPFRSGMTPQAYERLVAMVEHKDIIGHYDLPCTQVDVVAKNVALLVQFFHFIESRDAIVSNETKAQYWDEFVHALRGAGKRRVSQSERPDTSLTP